MGQLTLNDIFQMTQRIGENWAVAHAQRLMRLIKDIGREIPYDEHVLSVAAYTHDWGAFPVYTQKGVEHAVRSRQVVEAEILPSLDLSSPAQEVLLETIEFHDYRDLRPTHSNEALLLREADMIEFLGMMGMARDFARGPRDIEACHRRILERRNDIQDRFTLPRAKEIAQVRLAHMEQSLHWLEEESFGIL